MRCSPARPPPPGEMSPLALRRGASIWLRLSAPIALLALASSLTGLLVDRTYANETANWAGQAVGQDIANLVAFPALAWCAIAAAGGSLRAYLLWLGLLAFSAYSFAIYAFAMHFQPLFLVHVAVFGMSVYALIGGLASLDVARVKASFPERAPVRWTAALVFAIGSIFALLWLPELIPATLQDEPPASLAE